MKTATATIKQRQQKLRCESRKESNKQTILLVFLAGLLLLEFYTDTLLTSLGL